MPQDVHAIVEIIREKHKRLAELRSQVAILEDELRQIEQVVTGRQTEHRGVGNRSTVRAFTLRQSNRTGSIQPGSSTDRARTVLQGVGEPMAVDDMLELINADGGVEVKKTTLVSNLSRYVDRNDTFIRTAPNTYGLMDYGNRTEGSQR